LDASGGGFFPNLIHPAMLVVVYVPTEDEWQQEMPAWARGRREEIIENVRRDLGTKHYEYVFS